MYLELSKKTITIFSGPMGSGKTRILIDLYKRAMIAGQPVLTFKAAMDSRSESGKTETRNDKKSIEIHHEINSLSEIIHIVKEKLSHAQRKEEKEIVLLVDEIGYFCPTPRKGR